MLLLQVLALTEIQGVKGARARLLYKAGLRTPEAVAATDVDRWGVSATGCLLLHGKAVKLEHVPRCC